MKHLTPTTGVGYGNSLQVSVQMCQAIEFDICKNITIHFLMHPGTSREYRFKIVLNLTKAMNLAATIKTSKFSRKNLVGCFKNNNDKLIYLETKTEDGVIIRYYNTLHGKEICLPEEKLLDFL